MKKLNSDLFGIPVRGGRHKMSLDRCKVDVGYRLRNEKKKLYTSVSLKGYIFVWDILSQGR